MARVEDSLAIAFVERGGPKPVVHGFLSPLVP